MKAAQYNKYGGPDVIEVNQNAPRPTSAKGQVLVQVYAASINPIDTFVRAGYLKERAPLTFPVTIGGNFSGVVVEVGPPRVGERQRVEAGEDVSDFIIGDEVYGQSLVLNGGSGSIAEYTASNATNTARKPKNIDHLEAASLPLVGASAIQALEEHIQLKNGQKILIHGGAGGIGTIAIQLAKHIGAYVATTVATERVEFVKTLGADEVIDYKKEAFEDRIREFDAVFDTVGGATTDKSLTVLKKGGILVSMTGQPNPDLAKKFSVLAIGQMTDSNTKHLTRLAELVDTGVIKPQIDRVFLLNQAREAYDYAENSHPKGKVVVKIKE